MKTSVRRIIDQLFSSPSEEVYALLDAARDPLVYPAVRACGVKYTSLYAGAIPRELAEVAPYLVRLWREHPFTEELIEAGWGNSWGLFVSSPADLETMRRHLRRFLRVETEEGKKLVFRYYDPRVLRVYLPTCTADELTALYGPISTFYCESSDAKALQAYSRGSGIFTFTKTLVGAEPARALAVAE